MKIRALIAALSLLLLTAEALPPVPGDQATFDKGVKAYDAGRYEDAFEIFSDLAHKDDLAAMRNVALMLRRGQGVEKDPDEAIDWYERAAEAGLVTAQADLGVMLLDGEAGKPDPKAAMQWLTRAARAGHPTAQFRLGELYEKGTSFMAPDVEAAKKLYGAAAAHRQRGAAARLAALMGLTQPVDTAPTTSASDRVEVTSVNQRKRQTALPPSLRPSGEAFPDSRQPEPSAAPAGTPYPPEAATKHKTFGGPPLKPSR